MQAVDANHYMHGTVIVFKISAVPSVAFSFCPLLVISSQLLWDTVALFSTSQKISHFLRSPLLLSLPSLKCLNTP